MHSPSSTTYLQWEITPFCAISGKLPPTVYKLLQPVAFTFCLISVVDAGYTKQDRGRHTHSTTTRVYSMGNLGQTEVPSTTETDNQEKVAATTQLIFLITFPCLGVFSLFIFLMLICFSKRYVKCCTQQEKPDFVENMECSPFLYKTWTASAGVQSGFM